MILDSQPPDVSDEAAIIPRRRREFLRLGSIFGFVAAGFAAALLLRPFWENSQVPEQVATSRPRNPPTISEENFIWSETRTTVDRVLEKKEYWQEPLEQAEWHHLRSAYDYFQQELTRPRETEFDEAKHLIDLSYFARIAFHIRQFAIAEQALRELVRKTETMGHSGKRIPQLDQT
ncbi:MAG: hypothetical protein KDA80_23280, partial [Planctomycetaceae bacterium]|nr:hypothetical protein [Planctomycetaceae bacterium]